MEAAGSSGAPSPSTGEGWGGGASRSSSRDALARAGVYRLLASVYLEEIDAPLLDALRSYPPFARVIPPDDEAELLARLRTEYARLFLMNVHPYESAFVDEEAMLNTAATQTVVEAYGELECVPSSSRRSGAPDHVGMELEAMALLAEREAAASEVGDPAGAERYRAQQRSFLSAHLAAWAPVFADSVIRDARSPLYREIGSFTAEFLLADLDGLARHESRPTGSPPTVTDDPMESGGDFDLRVLVRRFTTPARSGFHISREALFQLAARLELPLAPVERWLMLDQLFHGAARYGQLSGLLTGLDALARGAASRYSRWQREYPGAAFAIQPWSRRARATVALLRDMRRAASK